jgi:hypothetical protein
MAALKKFVNNMGTATTMYTSSALDASSGRSSFATKCVGAPAVATAAGAAPRPTRLVSCNRRDSML